MLKKTNEFYSNNKQIQRFDSQISHCGVIISDKTKFNFRTKKNQIIFNRLKSRVRVFFSLQFFDVDFMKYRIYLLGAPLFSLQKLILDPKAHRIVIFIGRVIFPAVN